MRALSLKHAVRKKNGVQINKVLLLRINGKLFVFTESMQLGRGIEKPCSASPGSSTRGQGFPEGIRYEEETEVKLLSASLQTLIWSSGNCKTDTRNKAELSVIK